MGKVSNTRGVIEAIDLYCKKSNARVLKRLGLCLGANLGTSKGDCRNGILNQARSLEKLRIKRLQQGETSVTAIDVGISNFSYSIFEWIKGDELPRLVDWNKINLCQKFLEEKRVKMSMNPIDTWKIGQGLLEMLTTQLPISDIYALEKQRTRSSSSKNVIETILLSNILEHVLFSNLKNKQIYGKQDTDYIVQSSSPKKMVQYWCDLKSLKTLRTRYTEATGSKFTNSLNVNNTDDRQMAKISKVIRINLVRSILKNAIIPNTSKKCNLAPSLKSRIEEQLNSKQKKKIRLFDCISSGSELGTKKDDDLADSFLHGLSWIQWLRNYENVAEIVMKNRGAFDEHTLHEFGEYCMSLKNEWSLMSPKMKGNLAELSSKDDSIHSPKE